MNKLIREQIELINTTYNRTNGLYAKWAKRRGLNFNSLMVLYAIDGSEKCTQKQICEEWLIPKQTVNTVLKEFVQKGYVILKIASNDKRGRIVSFTELGHAYANKILSDLYVIEERTMLQMKPELRKMLVEGNLKFCEFFKKEVDHE